MTSTHNTSNDINNDSSQMGTNNILRNFASTNRNLFPVLARVVKVKEANCDNNGDIYYNTLLYHKVQKGSLLVLHGWTRHVKVLAKVADQKYYAVPLTYQGTFKVKLRTCAGLEDLISQSAATEDFNGSNYSRNKPAILKLLDKVRVVDIDKKFTGKQIKIGDIVRVICEKSSSGNHNKTPQAGEIVLDDASERSKEDSDSVLLFYRKEGRVRLEKIDFECGRAMEVVVPLDLNVTFEEVIETIDPSKIIWTIGELSSIIQRHSVLVEVVKGSSDHPTLDEDLPLGCGIELIQVMAEPSIYVSDQDPGAPCFHVPIRMEIYLKFSKQLSKKNSPLLNKHFQPLISTLDRCVEHLSETTYQELLQYKLSIESFLKVSQAKSKSKKLSDSERYSGTLNPTNFKVSRRTPSITKSDTSSKSSRWSLFSGSWRKRFSSSQSLPRARSFTADTCSQYSTMSVKPSNVSTRKDSRSLTRYPTSSDGKKKAKVIYLLSAHNRPLKLYKVRAPPDITLTPPSPPVSATFNNILDRRINIDNSHYNNSHHYNNNTYNNHSNSYNNNKIYNHQQQTALTTLTAKQGNQPIKTSKVIQESKAATMVFSDEEDNNDDDDDLVDGNVKLNKTSMTSSPQAQRESSINHASLSSLPLVSTLNNSNNDNNNSKNNINNSNYNKKNNLNQQIQQFTPLLNGQVIISNNNAQQFQQHPQQHPQQQHPQQQHLQQQHPQHLQQHPQQQYFQQQYPPQHQHSQQQQQQQHTYQQQYHHPNQQQLDLNFNNSSNNLANVFDYDPQHTLVLNNNNVVNTLQQEGRSSMLLNINNHPQVLSQTNVLQLPQPQPQQLQHLQQQPLYQQQLSAYNQSIQQQNPQQQYQQHQQQQLSYQQQQPYSQQQQQQQNVGNSTFSINHIVEPFNNMSISQIQQNVKSPIKHITVIDTYPAYDLTNGMSTNYALMNNNLTNNNNIYNNKSNHINDSLKADAITFRNSKLDVVMNGVSSQINTQYHTHQHNSRQQHQHNNQQQINIRQQQHNTQQQQQQQQQQHNTQQQQQYNTQQNTQQLGFANWNMDYSSQTAKKTSESSYKESPSLTKQKQVHFDEGKVSSQSDSGESSDSWTEQLTIPNDGNLYDFSVEKFCNFLHCLIVPEVVVDKCRKLRMNGKKFSEMTDEEIESLGLNQPLLQYFKKRTFRKASKKVKSNQKGAMNSYSKGNQMKGVPVDISHTTSDSGISSEKNMEISNLPAINL